MRTLRGLVCAALMAVILVASTSAEPASAAAGTGAEELAFVGKLNELRAAKGLAPLATQGALFDVARTWATRMLSAKGISHNPALASQGPAGWRRLGENVGVGYDVQGLHDAFVASPLHYKNMIDPAFDSVGVGVVRGDDGGMFVTVNFMSTGSGPVATAAPATVAAAAKATPRAKARRVCTKNSRGRVVCRTVR